MLERPLLISLAGGLASCTLLAVEPTPDGVGTTGQEGGAEREDDGEPEGGVDQQAGEGWDTDAGEDDSAAPASTAAGGADSEDVDDRVDGRLSTRYRGRAAGGVSDHDLYETLDVRVGDQREDDLTAVLLAQAALDVGSTPDAGDEFVFYSLQDTYDDALTGRLLRAYVDVHSVEDLERLRLGRQQWVDLPELLTFDGVFLETPARGDGQWSFGAYGGLPYRAYESSRRGDRVAGAFVRGDPWDGGRLRLDWMHLEDEERLGTARNDLLALEVGQRLGRGLDIELTHTRLEGEPRDVRFDVDWLDAEDGLVVRTSYYRLLEAQGELAEPLDPFFQTLFELFPYWRVTGLVSRSLGDDHALTLGLDARRVDDEDDIGDFNRDFERWYATWTAYELVAGLTAAVTGEAWRSEDSDVTTWDFDLSRDLGERWQVSLGSSFSLYDYDLYLGEERERVRAWYTRASHELGERWRLTGYYAYEDDDFEDFHTLRLGATWSF